MLKIKLLQELELLDLNMRVAIHENKYDEIKEKTTQVNKWKRLNSFPIKFISKNYSNLLQDVTHLKSGTGLGFSKIKIPEELTLKLAYLLGAMRDGSLIDSSGKHWVRLYDASDSTWIEQIQPIFYEIFEVRMPIRYQKKIGEKYLDISSKPLHHVIKILCDGKLHKDVPTIIKQADDETKTAYIEGFFDAEGCVPYDSVKFKRYRITFTQKDEKSLNFIKDFLSKKGIKTSKISNYSFAIYGKDMIESFNNIFKLLNRQKSERLQALMNI